MEGLDFMVRINNKWTNIESILTPDTTNHNTSPQPMDIIQQHHTHTQYPTHTHTTIPQNTLPPLPSIAQHNA